MWVKTPDGRLLNLEWFYNLQVGPHSDHPEKWCIRAFRGSQQHLNEFECLGPYESEEEARVVLNRIANWIGTISIRLLDLS